MTQKKYIPYPKYKLSGVEWIGEIPERWEVKDFKFIFRYQTGGTPRSSDRSFYDGNLTWVTINDLGERIVSTSNNCLNMRGVKEANIPTSPRGSLLISFKLSPGIVSFAGKDLYTNEAIATILPTDKKVDLKYWYYVFQNYFVFNANENIYGAKLFNQRAIKNSLLSLPPLTEQETIADFLDRETTRITGIVQKQTRKIELLREKRSALITQAVTKGLDPKAKMTDSGVAWIGEVPKTWEVRRLKWIVAVRLKYGANETAELDDPKLPRYIRITDFDDDGNMREETFKSLPTEKAKGYMLSEGDILFARSGATVGKTFQFKNYNGIACFAGYLIKATPKASLVNSDFLYYFTKSNSYESWRNAIFIQATIQNIGADKYQVLPISLPPRPEQQAIVEFLDRETGKIDAMVKKIEEQIALLNEYKQSLITHAVTGKIDVRGEVYAQNT